MKAFLIFSIAAALLAFVGVACGSDELTLEEYFQRLQAIEDNLEERAEALYEGFPGDEEELFSSDENLTIVKEFAAGFPAIFEDALDDVEELDPPDEAQEAHNELLAAGRGLVQIFRDTGSRVQEAESISEAEILFGGEEDPEIEAAEERFRDACLVLQGIADDNGIDVDLDCEEE